MKQIDLFEFYLRVREKEIQQMKQEIEGLRGFNTPLLPW